MRQIQKLPSNHRIAAGLRVFLEAIAEGLFSMFDQVQPFHHIRFCISKFHP